jgi:hypothetical protein
MTETNSGEPVVVPAPGDQEGLKSDAANDPSQTKLLPAIAALDKSDVAPGHDAHRMPEGPLAKLSPGAWLRKLSPSQIIWISLSIFLTFLVIFFWLIMQGRHKNKIFKPVASEQLEEVDENFGAAASNILKNRLSRQIVRPELSLPDDELAGQAPMAVKPGGPVISAAIDPELAAMVDALKKRLQISVDSQWITRGNIVIRVSKGDFRGFKIIAEMKIENKKIISEDVTVTFPKKGIIKTENGVLASFSESDPERFAMELRNAGLEIVKLSPGSANDVLRVQLRAIGIFGKPVADDLLISGKSVGKITLGMTTVMLENMLLPSYVVLKRKVLVKDIYHDVYKVLDPSNDPLFFVYENNNSVWGISIISDTFKTAMGIGIGSSLGNIRVNYPVVSLGVSEKKIPFVKIKSVDGLFVIQNEGVDFGKQIFPSKNKVISILIGKSLEFE